MNQETAGKHSADHLTAGCLSDAAGDPDDRDVKFHTVIMSQSPQGSERIFDQNIKFPGNQIFRLFTDHAAGRPALHGAVHKSVPVEALSAQGKKDTARLNLPAVCHY